MAPCCFCFSVCPFNEVQTGDKLKLHGPLAGFGLVLTKSFCTGKDASHWPVVLLHRSTPSLDSIAQLLLSSPSLLRMEALRREYWLQLLCGCACV